MRDRLGAQGRLQLTRVATPAGRPVWQASLPLSVLQSVLAGSTERAALVLVGREYAAGDAKSRDPYRGAHERVVAVDLVRGSVRAFDLTVEGGRVPLAR